MPKLVSNEIFLSKQVTSLRKFTKNLQNCVLKLQFNPHHQVITNNDDLPFIITQKMLPKDTKALTSSEKSHPILIFQVPHS